MTKNDLKKIMKNKGVRQWQVADKLKISEQALSRLFRYELKQADVDKIVGAIDDIAKENAAY